jgi:hypothetical protein
MLKLKSIILLVLVSFSTAFAQEKFTINGYVKDKATGETLIGATVLVKEMPSVGIAANEYGFYSITLPKGNYTLKASFVGYESLFSGLTLSQNTKLNFELTDGKVLEEVVISTKRKEDNLTQATMGTQKLDIKEIAKVPVLFGEKDVLKTLQLLPGIKSAGEGNSGFYVRGGSADQNLILLDEAPVYNASHLLGFFSTFNSDAIKDANIIKGNSPANYGGRLSSVLDVKMKDGNNKDLAVSGGLGMISSRLSVEGPIQQEKSSFLITGRRTYADMLLKASPDFKDNKLYFYDLNAKGNYIINSKNRLYLSGYFGQDKLGFGNDFGINWGNQTATLRWNSILNAKLFSNTSFIYSKYNYDIKAAVNENTANINSQIKDWNLKQEFQYFANTKNALKFGFNSIHHTITPSRFLATSDKPEENIGNDQNKDDKLGWENAFFINNTYTVNKSLSLDYGLRLSGWSMLGGSTYNTYTNGAKTDEFTLDKGTIGKTYWNLEPRFAMNYRLNNYSSLKLGYSRNTQNLHLLSNSTSTNPTDQWIGSSYNVKPEISDQIGLGYFRNFNDNNYEFSFETYYKNMQNQIDYRDAADINTAPDVESELLYGQGRAYGAEFFVKKKTGKLTGWVSYTLSKTERQIDGINNNQWYNAKQDRTHDLSVVGIYQLGRKWSLSSNFIYNTGNAVTLPSAKYTVAGNTTYYYSERNGYRMPAYHRLDLSATYEKQQKGRFQSSWNFGVYNIYGRENAYTITFQDSETQAGKTEAVQTSLFRWVPSVTYNFKF